MRKPLGHILPAAVVFSAALHLLAYGVLVSSWRWKGRSPRPGEGQPGAVLIEIGLHAPESLPPSRNSRPRREPENEPISIRELKKGPELLCPPEVSRPEEGESETDSPFPASLPATAGRAGRAEFTAGPEADDYLRRVRRRIEEATYYPRRARLNRLEGSVRVGFRIDSAGKIREPRLLEPSPHRLFNRAALEILARAAPFPAPVAGVAGNPISVSISFESAY